MGENHPDQVDGIPYFVNGAGGSWVSHFGEIDNGSRFRYNEDFGALMVETGETRITFRFVNRKGRIVDESSLVKAPGGTGPPGSAIHGTPSG